MASIVKHGTGWRAYLYAGGHRGSRVFRTRREASSWAAEREEQLKAATAAVRASSPLAAQVLGAVRLSAISEATKERMAAAKAAHVYVMQAGEHFKIGITADLDDRWRKVKTGNPLLDAVMHVIPRTVYAAWIEQEAHRLLSEFQVAGEWFSCDLRVALEVIQQLWRHSMAVSQEVA
jgi:hypothetical protein